MHIETRPGRCALLIAAIAGLVATPALAWHSPQCCHGWESRRPQAARGALRPALVFIGQATFPTGTRFEGTTVGGLSGLDYDACNQRFVAISDDRSDIDEARFYQLSIDLSDGTLADGDLELLSVTTIRDEDGAPFAPKSVDPESIRIAPDGGSLYWSSEGDASALIAPFVRQMTWDGDFIRELTAPEKFLPTADQSAGIRNNLAFESLTLDQAGHSLYTATENALYQDGSAATLTQGSPSRLIQYASRSGRVLAEYVYEAEPVVAEPVPEGSFSTNGLVELLALGSGRFISVERSFSTGVGNSIRLFLASTQGATDVSRHFSIQDARRLRPMRKTLLLDLGEALPDVVLENIEGISFGPRLSDGSRTLVLVADNNFSTTQVTQFLAFKLVE